MVNDGTPDNSVAVAQKFVDWYPQTFQIVSKENGGHGSAINTGVEHVTGKYFKVVDADDCVDTAALKNTIQFLECNETDAIIQSFRYYDISKDDVVYNALIKKSYSQLVNSNLCPKSSKLNWKKSLSE